MMRMLRSSETVFNPRCQPPSPMAETRSPVRPSVLYGISALGMKSGYYGIIFMMTRSRFRTVLAVMFSAAVVALPSAQTPPSGRAIGPIVAKVTVDVYSDFQCPHCKALAEQTLPRVKQEYALKDKIRLVHHDFPLPGHQYAKQAALFAAAADHVGKFEQVSDVLFKQQDTWGANGKVEEA